MADTVTTRIILNGPSNLVINFTNFSDGTGESGVTKVDATSATYAYKGVTPGIYLKVKRIDYIVRNMGLRLLWDAGTDETLAMLNGEGFLDWSKVGGRGAPAIAGIVGSILFTTLGQMINSSYDVMLHMKKGVPQS